MGFDAICIIATTTRYEYHEEWMSLAGVVYWRFVQSAIQHSNREPGASRRNTTPPRTHTLFYLPTFHLSATESESTACAPLTIVA